PSGCALAVHWRFGLRTAAPFAGPDGWDPSRSEESPGSAGRPVAGVKYCRRGAGVTRALLFVVDAGGRPTARITRWSTALAGVPIAVTSTFRTCASWSP